MSNAQIANSSPRRLLKSKDDSFRSLSRSSYGRWLMFGISLVALPCTFSTSSLTLLYLRCHITFPYLRCDLTKAVHSLGTVVSFRSIKVFLIKPNILEFLLTALAMCLWNFWVFVYSNTYRSFSASDMSKVVSFISYMCFWFELPKCNTFHLFSLNPNITPHFLWRSLGSFNLRCVQKWP